MSYQKKVLTFFYSLFFVFFFRYIQYKKIMLQLKTFHLIGYQEPCFGVKLLKISQQLCQLILDCTNQLKLL